MKIGFIGCGNMATSIIKGIIRKQIIDAENIIASAKTKATLDRVQKELGVKVSTDNLEVTENSDILVLAVKPQYYPEVIAQIKDVVRKEQIVISIAPENIRLVTGTVWRICEACPDNAKYTGTGW